MIKKTLVLVLCVVAAFAANAQSSEPDSFEVGPYNVDYYGPGEFNYQLKKNIDLFKYFKLKKDTVINVVEPTTEPVKSAFQIGIFMAVPRYVVLGASNVFGLEGSWKLGLSEQVYFNAGLSFGVRMGKFHRHTYDVNKNSMIYDNEFKETVMEIGVPISIEFTKLDRKKASLFGSIGVVPTFFTGAQGEMGKDYNTEDNDSKSGFYVAPRIEVGGYIPMGGKLVRIGGFYQNNLNCTPGDYDVYKMRIGRGHVGAKAALVF
ncbi:MAG: hypothetical protein IJJ83_10955 [Muribaculaceae bacterium]|jgi:hypothetical protein|nr:hypothetical protein [Muribaculaceae bacterium]